MHNATTRAELEELNVRLNDDAVRQKYQKNGDGYRASFLPRLLGNSLIGLGNLVYGRKPSYLKFRAIEVIARVPYHSWASATYTVLTLFYMDEARALKLSRVTRYAGIAQENETMHVVAITTFAAKETGAGFIRYTAIPVIFAFFYFWAAYWLYLANSVWSYELNYLFESHAYEQYGKFLTMNEKELKARPAKSRFLSWYGRSAENQYDFFCSVRNDELIHRNIAYDAIRAQREGRRTTA